MADRPAPRRRADALRNARAILDAAAHLLDEDGEAALTMEAVAARAGVGKGTVFRSFGDKAGLLRALLDERVGALKASIEHGPPPLGPSTPPRDRIEAILLAFIAFKVDHRGLMRALEHTAAPSTARSFLTSPQYRWAYDLVARLLGAAGLPPARAAFQAHVLLSLTRVDLIDHLIGAERMGRADLDQEMRLMIRRLLT